MKKRTFDDELKAKGRFRVSIFGSARIKKGDKIYEDIFKLSKSLGEVGIDVVTGGGGGLMGAASSGHKAGSKKTGAHTIGLNIRLPHEQKPNKYLDVVKEFSRFSSRLDKFMLLSNAVVVAPAGGVGTMLEFFYTWQLVQVEHICDIPIILWGPMWKDLIKWLEKYPMKKKYFDKEDLHKIFLADNRKEVIKIIARRYEHFMSGDKDFCLNHKKYKID